MSSGGSAEGMYLTYLLSSEKLTKAEVYVCITELLLGGVDTVRGEQHTHRMMQRSQEVTLNPKITGSECCVRDVSQGF